MGDFGVFSQVLKQTFDHKCLSRREFPLPEIILLEPESPAVNGFCLGKRHYVESLPGLIDAIRRRPVASEPEDIGYEIPGFNLERVIRP